MSASVQSVKVSLEDPSASDADLDEEIRSLSAALTDAGLRPVRAHDVTAPAGSKGVAAEMATVVIDTLHHESLAFLAVACLEWFHARHRHGRMRIQGPNGEEIAIPDTDPDEAKRIVSSWSPADGSAALPGDEVQLNVE